MNTEVSINKQILSKTNQIDTLLKEVENLLAEEKVNVPVLSMAQKARLIRVSEQLLESRR